MAKNVYTRMAVAITNICNQKCTWCFEGSWTRQHPPQFLSLENFEKLLHWKDWSTGRIPVITLYGGEPTLHPNLLEMIDMVNAYNPKISIILLTNLVCRDDIIQELISRKVKIVANIDQFEAENNTYNIPLIIKNLEYLNGLPEDIKYNISVTVSHPEKDFSFLYEILNKGKNHIFNLRIAPSAPGFRFENEFPKEMNFKLYSKILEVVTRCKEISPHLTLSGECPANYCMISEELVQQLEAQGYKLSSYCGEVGINADILTDLSSCWCFAFHKIPEMSIENVFDYSDYDSMIGELEAKYIAFQQKYPIMCEKSSCKNNHCAGFCPALNYYQYVVRNV